MKTSELVSTQLDWAVAKCESFYAVHLLNTPVQVMVEPVKDEGWYDFTPSSNWAQGGPIIEREKIAAYLVDTSPDLWAAQISDPWKKLPSVFCMHGPTPLIAAMRCYVARKLGDEIDIPEELL